MRCVSHATLPVVAQCKLALYFLLHELIELARQIVVVDHVDHGVLDSLVPHNKLRLGDAHCALLFVSEVPDVVVLHWHVPLELHIFVACGQVCGLVAHCHVEGVELDLVLGLHGGDGVVAGVNLSRMVAPKNVHLSVVFKMIRKTCGC